MTARYDVVVIGGGIHGVGVAQAVAAAGHPVLVLERHALAHGTSSRSSKLIHGGLRYLESGQWRLVRESLHERAVLLSIAPELVRLMPFFIPVYRHTRRRAWQIRTGLALYALLGDLAADARFAAVRRTGWKQLDGLNTSDLQAVFRYFDAQTDDAALTRAVMASAANLGAELACPARFAGATRTAQGYRIRYTVAGQERECEAATLVNAAGPWVNEALALVEPVQAPLSLELVQGTHIVVPGKVTQGVYYTEAPADGRAVFVMPWTGGTTLVGTTETPYAGNPDGVLPLAHEVAYLQATLAHYFPGRESRVLSAFAGVRVLPAAAGGAFHRARETRLWTDDARAPRLVSVYGGKLTGYRLTATKVLRTLSANLPVRRVRADTATLALSPADAPVTEPC
jgi:glycerol-3-phosphate dehydrogenase